MDAKDDCHRAFFNFLLPVLFSEFDIIEVPDWFVRGDSPAYEAKCPGVGKSDISPTVMRICAAVFGPIPGMDSRICVWGMSSMRSMTSFSISLR